MDNGFSSVAYIEPTVLEGWKTSMSQINSSCLQELANFKTHASGLNDAWRGYSATGYIDSFDGFLAVVEEKHEIMKNLDAFIEEVVITMDNE